MHELTAAEWLDELRARWPETRIHRVVFRATRSTIFSLTRHGSVLNLNASFASAPAELLDAFVTVLRNGRTRAGTESQRRALRRLREWQPLVDAIRAARASARVNGSRPARAGHSPGACCATPDQRAHLHELYFRLNRGHFGGRLPAGLSLRLSARMSRRLGQIRLLDGPPRRVAEIALSADLMLEANHAQRRDTMLHEMAHAEAFLLHGHRGHGRIWRRIAERVGCEPRACTAAHVARRRRGAPQV